MLFNDILLEAPTVTKYKYNLITIVFMKAKHILIGLVTVILVVILISNFSYFDKQYYQYGSSKLVVGEKNTARGVFLSSCSLENYDDCLSRAGMKSGPAFEVCEWDYNLRTFKEVGRYPNCIFMGDVSDEQLQEFKNYLNKEVEITGTLKSIKVGSNSEGCEMLQIGCERDTTILVPEKITVISE